MPTRFGLRINPTSGTETLSFALGSLSLGWGEVVIGGYQPDVLDVLDAGGGSFTAFGPFDFGLSRSVNAGSPWTTWFAAPPGEYESANIAVVVGSYDVNVRIRLLVEIDGVESQLFSAIEPALDGRNGPMASTYQEFSLTVGPGSPGYSNFWTTFNRTRENAPT